MDTFKTFMLGSIILGRAALASASPASYLDADPGARPSGMGSAFTALSDDGNAPLFNPAGLANMGLHPFEVSASMGILAQDQLHDFISFSQQLPPDCYLGFHALQYGVLNIDGRDSNGLPTSSLQDTELMFASSFAYEFGYHFKAGISASFLYQSLADMSARGFGGVDVGFLWVPSVLYDLTFGACARHLGGFLSWDRGATESLDPVIRVGVSQKWFSRTLVLAYDAEFPIQPGTAIAHHAGLEWWAQKALALRCGWDRTDPTVGLSLRYLNYGLDYSFLFDSRDLGDQQRITLDLLL